MADLTQIQHLLRKDTITGSTAASLMGFSPYVDPVGAWEQHTGKRVFVPNDDTIAGTELEDGLGGWACKDLGIVDAVPVNTQLIRDHAALGTIERIINVIGLKAWHSLAPDDALTLRHPDIRGFGATPDLISVKEKIGLQIKNHRPYIKSYKEKPGRSGKWDNAAIPLHINIQCQWEMYNTAAALQDPAYGEAWVLVSYFGGPDRRIYWIRRDSILLNGLISGALTFWRNHLDPSGPCTAPTEWPWRARPVVKNKPMKLTPAERAAAPIPFQDIELGEELLDNPIPFGD